jgi:DNA replication and repair protein RecF
VLKFEASKKTFLRIESKAINYMYLSKLHVINFKNYADAKLEFDPRINCFVGLNGMGKTNLLDAIHYLTLCKSYFNPIDSQNIMHDSPFFVLQGFFNKDKVIDEVYCGIKRNYKKQFKINKKEYERLADHIGHFPLVMISPSDAELILDGSEVRRKFIDSVIAQFDKHYLENLMAYNRSLAQRNALLKSFSDGHTFNMASLDIWDEQLILHGTQIFKKRQEFLSAFIPIFQNYYQLISNQHETVDLEYNSKLVKDDFKTLLMAALPKDRVLNYTTVGVHKDDLEFKLEHLSIKKFASQGQQKSYLIALKLAQHQFIKQVQKQSPILMLDDIYDKLDESRFKNLVEMVSSEDFGQVFITDTHKERMRQLFSHMSVSYKIFEVEQGQVKLEQA